MVYLGILRKLTTWRSRYNWAIIGRSRLRSSCCIALLWITFHGNKYFLYHKYTEIYCNIRWDEYISIYCSLEKFDVYLTIYDVYLTTRIYNVCLMIFVVYLSISQLTKLSIMSGLEPRTSCTLHSCSYHCTTSVDTYSNFWWYKTVGCGGALLPDWETASNLKGGWLLLNRHRLSVSCWARTG